MGNSWIPPGVAVAVAIVFLLVVFNHIWHMALVGGRHRLWHAGHILMALGMIIMFLPGPRMLVPTTAGIAVFTLAAVALAGYLLTSRLRGRGVGALWLASVLDLVWMALMFDRMDSHTPRWLGVVGAAWFGAQALAWASGLLGRVLDQHGLGPASSPAQPEEQYHGIVDGGTHDWSVRVSLTLMGLGMAYMFLALAYGMASMPTMPGMPPMSGTAGMPGMTGMPPARSASSGRTPVHPVPAKPAMPGM